MEGGQASSMFEVKPINTDHKDLIHDVSYDFYGRRMATCSSDQSVKVTELCSQELPLSIFLCVCVCQVWDVGEDGQWRCTSTWKVSFSLFNACQRPRLSNSQVCPLSLFPADPLWVGVEGDLGPPRVWSGAGHLLIRQDSLCLGRTK